MPDGKIRGLPDKADNLLNKTKDNANVGVLDGGLAPQSSGNMYSDMYKYQFKKIL